MIDFAEGGKGGDIIKMHSFLSHVRESHPGFFQTKEGVCDECIINVKKNKGVQHLERNSSHPPSIKEQFVRVSK